MNENTQPFLDRLDTFAEGLSTEDQQLLLSLLNDDEDVAGFAFEPPWPGVRSILSPTKLSALTPRDGFLSSGHTTGSNISSGDLGSGR